jgi:hypothetical protein
MLTNPEVKGVYVIRLVSGEEIIADFEQIGDTFIAKNPAIILMGQTPQGMSIGLIPFMPFVEDKIHFRADALTIAPCKASVEMYNNYSKMFGTGITLSSTLPDSLPPLRLTP